MSDGSSGEVSAARMVAGGSPCDSEPGGVLQDDAAAKTAAQFEDEEARTKTLDEELRRC